MFLYCLVGVLLSLIGAFCRAEERIVLLNGEWPPYQSAALKEAGFVSHVVTRAFALSGVAVEYQFRPWKRALEEARSGLADGTLVWSHTPEREADFLFSDPVLIGESVLFHRIDNPITWTTFDDLSGYRIGGTLGYEYAIELGQGVVIDRVSEDRMNVSKLLLGRIDLFPSDRETGYALLRQQFSPQQQAQITHHPKPYEQTQYSVIFPKRLSTSETRARQLNAGLRRLQATGEYQRILQDQRAGRFESATTPTQP